MYSTYRYPLCGTDRPTHHHHRQHTGQTTASSVSLSLALRPTQTDSPHKTTDRLARRLARSFAPPPLPPALAVIRPAVRPRTHSHISQRASGLSSVRPASQPFNPSRSAGLVLPLPPPPARAPRLDRPTQGLQRFRRDVADSASEPISCTGRCGTSFSISAPQYISTVRHRHVVRRRRRLG